MAASVSSIRVVTASGQTVTGVGNYRYIAMLAEGGMADVYLAVTRSAGFEKLVVIKQLRESLAADPTFVAMFMDEARLAARLNHPNVVQTLEVGTDARTGLHFIAMEFLEGVAYVRLARLKERIPPPLAFHVRILVDVLRGLHYAHELCDFDGKPLNVVHRDVSPQNVMLTFAGGVKILDFGIAKAALAAEQRPEDFKGKLEYMAPEQARLEDVDRRADVFSVGVMLYEAIARRRLFRKGDEKLRMLKEGLLPNIAAVAPSAPKRLHTICAKAMAPDRDVRYPTADAMADDLEEWLGSTTQHVAARDVGSWIADKFADKRAKIALAIEAQLALFRSLADDAPETIPLSRLPVTDLPDAMESQAISAMRSIPPPPPVPEIAAPSPIRANTAIIAAAVAIAGVVLLAGVVALASRKPKAEVAEVASAPEAEAPLQPLIDFTIKASPPEAKISLDGTPLGANPASGKRPRDGTQHRIRIEAPGYDTRDESIVFEQSMLVNIELRPTPPAFEVTPAAVPTAKTAPATRGPAPKRKPRAPGGKPLDSENPYQ